MRIVKIIACILAFLIVFNSVSFAATSTTVASSKQETTVDNQKLMVQKLRKIMKKNGLNKNNFEFGYYDIFRDFECYYNRNTLFEPYEAIKFPLAFLYFNDYAGGKYTNYSTIAGKNFLDIFIDSLTVDTTDSTEALINNYGGIHKVKSEMQALTKTKVPAAFYTSEQVNANYCIDFLKLYYQTAKYSSTDFKNMLVDSLKEFTPGKYSEKYITKYRITHRYGYSALESSAVDMGIVKSDYPFAFVVSVQGVKNAEDVLAEVMRFAYEYNEDFGALLISQMTTMPDIPEDNKKAYVTRSYTKPILAAVVVVSALVVAGVAIFMVQRDKKLRKIYEQDDDENTMR